jgi:hypothetical protein
MTLVEVLTSLAIMGTVFAGILACLMQTRRLAAASIFQNCAITIVQGYIEQIKNIPLQQFVNASVTDTQNNPVLTTSFSLPTLKDQSGAVITLQTTPSGIAASTLLNATPGTTPTGVVDNLQSFDMDSRVSSGTTTWASIWPNANTTLAAYPTETPKRSDLRMNFWVHITDLTPTSAAKFKSYGVLIVYTWQYTDGNRLRYAKDSVRTIRSAVQTF